MIDPISTAFTVLVLHLHAPLTCKLPGITYSSLMIDAVCQYQQGIKPNNIAESCYDLKKRVIILRDGWDLSNHRDETRLYHEMDRHVEQVCLHRVFTEAEPYSVLEAEDLAP